MTKSEVQDLTCTTLVRRGNVLGLVVGTTETAVKICWDDQGATPTSYSRKTEALNDVVVVRKADKLKLGDPVVNRFRKRRRNA